MACGAAICIDPYAACDVIFTADVCEHTPEGNCGIMTQGTSGNATKCADVCAQARVRCLGSITTQSCSQGNTFDSNTCNNVLPQEALVECVCAPYCDVDAGRPCKTNESCRDDDNNDMWECVPNS